MVIQIVYLASLRELAGLDEERVALPDGVGTVGALIAWLRARGGTAARAFEGAGVVRAAVNQRFAKLDARIAAGDEVAFFPPVTGG